MKKLPLSFRLAIIACVASGSLTFAQEPPPLHEWKFSLGLGAFYTEKSPKLEPVGESKTATLSGFNDDVPDVSNTSVLPIFGATYRDDSGTWIFGRAPSFQFGMIRKQRLNVGQAEFVAGIQRKKQYTNLYAINTERDVTDSLEIGTLIKYTYGERRDLLKFSVSGRYADIQFADDDTTMNLGRSGQQQSISAGIGLFLLQLEYSNINFKAVGNADAFDANAIRISAFAPIIPGSLAIILGYRAENRHHNGVHPLFSLKRHDKIAGMNLVVNWNITTEYAFNAFFNDSRTSSNIDFFDIRSRGFGLGLRYTF